MITSELELLEDFPPVSYEEWRQVVETDLKGAPFEKRLVSQTYEGIGIQPVYCAQHWDAQGDPSGFPGMAPTTRGGGLLGNAVTGWELCQEHMHPDLALTQAAILTDLERGVNSLLLRLDAAARNLLDPEMEEARHLVGRDGLPIYARQDLDLVLAGVHLDMVGIHLEAGAAFLPAAAMLASLWQTRGLSLDKVSGAFNADPLAVLARDGRLPCSIQQALGQMAELAAWTNRHAPGMTAVRVGSGPYHHAGAHAAQDLGFSMATAVCYLRAMTDRGMSILDAARQIRFAYSLGCNQFLAIAKLRAARKLWASVLSAAGIDPDEAPMRMHARMSKRVITARDPWVNMLRNTVCCFTAAVGGAQTITSEPFDKAIGLPDDLARRIARNTAIILQEESHLLRVVDPAGGCWMLESLTDELAEKSWQVFQQVEQQGGMAEALADGWIAQQIDSAFKPRLKNLSTRKDPITGVSEFPNLGEKPVVRTAPDFAGIRHAAMARRSARGEQTGGQVACTIVSRALSSGRPGAIMEAAVDAAGGDASLADIHKALVPDPAPITQPPLSPHPYAEPFEQLRDASDAYMERTGARPKVFLANLGPVAAHIARATYSRNFFEAGGFEVIGNNGFADADAAAESFRASGAKIAVICSSDPVYQEMVGKVGPALRRAGARDLILAGHPGSNEVIYREAGVDRFIFIRCDVLSTLRDLLREEGVL
ncbi:MAG: methylmalonyl-CoA mutase small subunit [Phycisphaeraceae bacterium]|nr:methylmalonyl-CoA mutase small subunit [Phycisphaeraceae bacterium]